MLGKLTGYGTPMTRDTGHPGIRDTHPGIRDTHHRGIRDTHHRDTGHPSSIIGTGSEIWDSHDRDAVMGRTQLQLWDTHQLWDIHQRQAAVMGHPPDRDDATGYAVMGHPPDRDRSYGDRSYGTPTGRHHQLWHQLWDTNQLWDTHQRPLRDRHLAMTQWSRRNPSPARQLSGGGA